MTEHETPAADADTRAARAGRSRRPSTAARGLAAALLLPAALTPGLAAAAQTSKLAQSPSTNTTAIPQLSAAPAATAAKKASTQARSPKAAAQRSGSYAVRSGESLWTICERLAGPGASPTKVANALVKLWNANDVHIGTGDPDMLPAGIVLKVPASLR